MPAFRSNPRERAVVDTGDATRVELNAVRARELELKRARGEISCAECRRLKRRCDKKVPCSTCIARGCPEICPMGTDARSRASQHVSSVSAGAQLDNPQPTSDMSLEEERHFITRAELSVLVGRIRALEGALRDECLSRQTLKERGQPTVPPHEVAENIVRLQFRQEHSQAEREVASGGVVGEVVTPMHPLLSQELVEIEDKIRINVLGENNTTLEHVGQSISEVMRLFGTLSVNEAHAVHFLGASAAERALLKDPSEVESPAFGAHEVGGTSFEDVTASLVQAGAMWPHTPAHLTTPIFAAQLVAQLPSIERASTLVETYYLHLAWLRCPVDRSQFTSEQFPLFYPHFTQSSDRAADIAAVAMEKPHELALTFALFALGAALDLTLPVNNGEAERYYMLARAALGLRNVFEHATLSACQTMYLLASFKMHSGRHANQETSWRLASFGADLAISIGLHRDPQNWKLDPELVEKRRKAFWEIYLTDLWRCLGTGRPSHFRRNAIDVQLPNCCAGTSELEESSSEESRVQEWRFRFGRDVLSLIAEKLCSAQPIQYSEIIELDRAVRSFESNPNLDGLLPQDKLKMWPESFRLRPRVVGWVKELALLYIHRSSFARAVIDFPDNPMSSPFAPSVLSACRSASRLLRIFRIAHEKLPEAMRRLWPMWAQALTSAVILATLCSKAPTTSFAESASEDLELTLKLFEEESAHPLVKQVLPLLRRLRDDASVQLTRTITESEMHPSNSGEDTTVRKQVSGTPASADAARPSIPDELLILRGDSRLIRLRAALRATEAHLGPADVRLRDAQSRAEVSSVPIPSEKQPHVSTDYSQSIGAGPSSAHAPPSVPTQNLIQGSMHAQDGIHTFRPRGTESGDQGWHSRGWTYEELPSLVDVRSLRQPMGESSLNDDGLTWSQFASTGNVMQSFEHGQQHIPAATATTGIDIRYANLSWDASVGADPVPSTVSAQSFTASDADSILAYFTPVGGGAEQGHHASAASADAISSADWVAFMRQAGFGDADMGMEWENNSSS